MTDRPYPHELSVILADGPDFPILTKDGITDLSLDEDGTPYLDPGSTAVQILADTDTKPYFNS